MFTVGIVGMVGEACGDALQFDSGQSSFTFHAVRAGSAYPAAITSAIGRVAAQVQFFLSA